MGLFDFFKTNGEIERELRKAQRKQQHRVENVIDNLDDKVKDYEKERDKIWEQAKIKLQSGQKAEAARLLNTYKSKQTLINQTERRKQYAERTLDKINSARDMKELTDSLGKLATMSDFSPEQMEENVETINMATDDINDMSKIFEKAMERDMEQLNRDMERTNGTAEEDDLMKALEAEVSGSLLGDKIMENTNIIPEKQEIDANTNEIRKLLENN
ncbi:MAG: hypothetical protein IJW05_09845 [Lentisphaeria bacterium]|nr:hypothetical protein [Lentisphaeria bacterium]